MPFVCANAGRGSALRRTFFLLTLALVGCGGSAGTATDAAVPDGATSLPDSDVGRDAATSPDTGCMLPLGTLAALSLEAPGLAAPSCADPVAVDAAPVTVLLARITATSQTSDALRLDLDFCSPAAPSCTGMNGALTVGGAFLDSLMPPGTFQAGQFLEVHWRVASPSGGGVCTRELEVRNPDAWDGVMNPIRGYTPQFLLAAAHGVAGTLPGSLLTVTATPERTVTDAPGCPSGALSSLSFGIAGGSPIVVEHGQAGIGYSFMSLLRFYDLSSIVPASRTADTPDLDWIVSEHLLTM